MAQNLGALEHTGAQVVAGPVVVTDTDAGVEEAQALWRTRVLLVRSCIAAVGIIFAQLSNFSHPYIPRTLTAMLPLEGLSDAFAERASLREDVDRCLSTLARKIPTRLSVPLLLQSAPAILKAGHSAACRFADLMAEVWQQLDRTTVVAHLAPLSTLATLLLDYRRVFGDQSPAAAEVDAAASDAVVELCLKLTESELKSFMTRLAEWRDIKFKLKMQSNGEDDPAHAWRRYARAVSYFSLADALMGKLKSIFIPIMGVLWGSAIDLLNAFAAQAAKAPTSSAKKVGADGEGDNTGKKDKNAKRKAAESVEQEESSGARAPLLVEFELLGGYILSSVRECCAQDTAGFVDEVRVCGVKCFPFYGKTVGISITLSSIPICSCPKLIPISPLSAGSLREDDAVSGAPALATARLRQRGRVPHLHGGLRGCLPVRAHRGCGQGSDVEAAEPQDPDAHARRQEGRAHRSGEGAAPAI
jgi:hypothetical protein